jgi:hypothetical protein
MSSLLLNELDIRPSCGVACSSSAKGEKRHFEENRKEKNNRSSNVKLLYVPVEHSNQ